MIGLLPAIALVTPNPAWLPEVQERWEGLGLEVEVVSIHCGYDNASYSPSKRVIVMCDDLYNRPDLAKWIFNHEMGHALTFQLGVPMDPTGVDEERVADEVAFFASKDVENYAAIKWFMDKAASGRARNPADPHPSAFDRAGELLCLQVGWEHNDLPPVDTYDHACKMMFESLSAHWSRLITWSLDR